MSRAWTLILCAALLASPDMANAQESVSGQTTPDIQADGWQVGIAPYAWFASLRGELSTIAGLDPVSVNRSASHVLEDLDSVFMFLGQVRKGRYGGLVGFIYSSTSTSGAYPGPEYSTLATSTENYTVDAAAFYRGWIWEAAFVDAVVGGRIWTAKLDTDLGAGTMPRLSATEDQTWVDPLIGAKARYTRGETGWFASGFAFIGGFGVGSDFMWDIDANVGFQWVPAFSTLIGYRYLDVKYKDGDFVYDVAQDGLILAIALSF